ncbi:MAG: hypothetical protein IJM57_02700 [Lachnospiraceae bacterium]|nr:hypothetical protein [Lachnospiraceae bacterium]
MFILLYVCSAVILFTSGKAAYTRFLQMRCKESVTGRYLYPEKRLRVIGRYVEPCWNPVYEYCVGKAVYKVEVEIMSPNDRIKDVNVEVRYLPSDPGICFIDGIRGRIRSRKKKQ